LTLSIFYDILSLQTLGKLIMIPLFTDLDNTVFLLQNKSGDIKSLCNVDYVVRRDMHICMTPLAHRIYLDLCDRRSLIAVTSRSLQQYTRTRLANFTPIAIVDNGATILINGQEDQYWSNYINNQMDISGIDHNAALDEFIFVIGQENLTKEPDRFKYFSIAYLNEEANARVAANMSEFTKPGFKSSLQGGKFYFFPEFLTKGLAVQYLCLKMGIEEIVSAGDSLPDLEFMLDAGLSTKPPSSFGFDGLVNPRCVYSLISPYGELYEQSQHQVPVPNFMPEPIEGKAALVCEQLLVEYCKRFGHQDLL
jgi:hypothetical protein